MSREKWKMSKSIGEVECKSRPAELSKSRPVELSKSRPVKLSKSRPVELQKVGLPNCQKVGRSNCKKSACRIVKKSAGRIGVDTSVISMSVGLVSRWVRWGFPLQWAREWMTQNELGKVQEDSADESKAGCWMTWTIGGANDCVHNWMQQKH
jgi:hypothetical protein